MGAGGGTGRVSPLGHMLLGTRGREVSETLLDAPEAEGLSASRKVHLFQTPAPLTLWL